MKKPIIVTKLKVTQFKTIKSLADGVYKGMHLNPNFVNPQPSLSLLQMASAQLGVCLEKWGEKGNRGSHLDYVNLTQAAKRAHSILTQLAAWCMSSLDPDLSYPDQTNILTSSGFPLKNAGSPQGRLEPVENFHRFIARNLREGEVKLRWRKPLSVTTITNVKSYLVYRSKTDDFTTASVIASSSKTVYIDTPGEGISFYWVGATNNMGSGAYGSYVRVNVAL